MMEEEIGRHVYNIIKAKNGEEYSFDLEQDLMNIHFGARTRNFGIGVNNEKTFISEKNLKEIDTNRVNYIPEGYYLEDMIYMLELAIKNPSLRLDEKVEMVLKNIEKYRNTKNAGYRERSNYHELILNYMFSAEKNKIDFVDCYKKNDNDEKQFQTCIVVNTSHKGKNSNRVFMYSLQKYEYEEITMKQLASMVKDGLVLSKGVMDLRQYMKDEECR